MKDQNVFHKELYEDIRTKIKGINKIKECNGRIDAITLLRDSIYGIVCDEVDMLLSEVNLRKNKNEEE